MAIGVNGSELPVLLQRKAGSDWSTLPIEDYAALVNFSITDDPV